MITMWFRCFAVIVVLFAFGIKSFGKMYLPSKHYPWSLMMGFESNYTGNNALLHGSYLFQRSEIDAGLNYNLSDGFSANPVLGFGLGYQYKVVYNRKWSASIGLDYRRQKPLKIVNIQLLNYTTGVTYKFGEHFNIKSKLGYGLAAERAASAGSFAQSNTISGSFYLGCVYRL
jgi:hypothetical protein